ncbi:BtrH N-terminal domain-containing protein [Bacillus cereus]|nr:BtrH N-terminal domain-containing protein [Bacillus cereus]
MVFISANNCLFHAITKNLNHYLNTDISEAEIFLCFGGYIFSVSRNEEALYEDISITGNWIDFDHFSDFTNVRLELSNYRDDSNMALNYIINKVTSNNIQLAIVNSYYLPFDSVNYKKNFGNHLILIEKYREYEKCFYVTDQRYNQEMIDLNDITIALTSNFNTDIKLVNILNDGTFDVTKIRNNIPLIIKNNAKKNHDNSKCEFEKLNKSLEKINMLDTFYRSLSYFDLMMSIKSPHGPITSKQYLINSSYIKNSFLNNLLKKSILKWERLCMDLYKAHLNDEILDFSEKIDLIEELENGINDTILEVL